VIDRPEVLTDLAAVEDLAADWRALASSSARSALEAPDWLLPLARRYLTRYGIRFLTWHDGNDLVGVAPLSLIGDRPPVRPVRQLAWWGSVGPRMRGLVDVQARDDVRGAVLDSFCAWLRSNGEWDVLRLLRPQFESATPARLRAEARAAGWTYGGYANLRSTTYQLDLPATAEGWDKHLGSKARKVMRWEERKFAARGGKVDAAVPANEIPAALDAVERLLRDRWGANEVYFARDPAFRGLLHESIPALAERGEAWLTVARDEDGIQGALVSVAHNGFAMALMVAMTTDAVYRPFSLGKHLFDVGLAEAVRRGCQNYDFLWVGGYKESFWHATPRLLESAMVGRGLIGRPLASFLARREAGPLAPQAVSGGTAESTT
jgi:CelD/BcsL family acetyltransferase involved in cellulose biosynthesis